MKNICVVVLAAGSSNRLGSNKLLLKIDNTTVIERSIIPFYDIADNIFIVTGFEKERLNHILENKPVQTIFNPFYREGMSTSLKAAVPFVDKYEGVFIQLGDRPFIDKAFVKEMIDVFFNRNAKIIVPVYKGQKGHPVLIRLNHYIKEIPSIKGDEGLREIIDKYREDVLFIEGYEGNILGIDTSIDLQILRERGYRIEED